MAKSIFLIIVIVFAIGFSGCTESKDIISASGAMPDAGNSDSAKQPAPTIEQTYVPITPTPEIDSTPPVFSEKQNLQSDIDNAPYNTTEYQENIFDCSNMAALLHDWLETQTETKWNVEVWFGCESPSCREGHEWLEVIGNESNYTVEVTSKNIVDHFGNSNESYREYYSYFNRHYSSLPKGSGGFIDPKENTYPKRW